MKHAYSAACIAVLLLACTAPLARAGLPSPFSSSIPAVVLGSPDGLLTSTVVVHDLAYNPIQGSFVVLDFSACPQFHPCPSVCPDCTVDPVGRQVRMFTGANGAAAFPLRLGGAACPNPSTVRIYADGVLLGTANFAALDQDGDLTVTVADKAAVHAVLGAHDPRADFDGDGFVTAADEALLDAHMGATCDLNTAASRATWGQLKTIYR